MYSMRVTSKGQVTIPKELRDELNLREGSRLAFYHNDRGEVVIAKASNIAFNQLARQFGKVLNEKGITQEDIEKELAIVREEMRNERSAKQWEESSGSG
jgi:antitoxin PrlF